MLCNVCFQKSFLQLVLYVLDLEKKFALKVNRQQHVGLVPKAGRHVLLGGFRQYMYLMINSAF